MLQVLQRCASKKEWEELLENATISSLLWYDAADEKKEFTDEECQSIYSNPKVYEDSSPGWVRVALDKIMDDLNTARKGFNKYGNEYEKGMNSFLKLFINTIYGCTASEFFSEIGRCISNVVIGNNITARARALAWLMAKGFHSYISVTDGGVFQINAVLKFDWRYVSLHALEDLCRISNDSLLVTERVNRRNSSNIELVKFAEKVPLFDEEKNYEWCEQNLKNAKDTENISEIDIRAWLHLKEQFGGNRKYPIDILDYDQFKFETKNAYVKMIVQSKINYVLYKTDEEYHPAFRGMPKVYDDAKKKKMPHPDITKIMEAEVPKRFDIMDEHIIGLNEGIQKNGAKLHEIIKYMNDDQLVEDLQLPGDVISVKRTYYSHTPLYMRHKTLNSFREMVRDYSRLRNTYKDSTDEAERNYGAKIISELGLEGL